MVSNGHQLFHREKLQTFKKMKKIRVYTIHTETRQPLHCGQLAL